MAAHQAPPSLGFSRQEHWSGLPFPSPMHESEKWKWSRSVVSNPQRPHGLQPTRLFRPWYFPGKSTGVGCHCLLHPPPLETTISTLYFQRFDYFSNFIYVELLSVCLSVTSSFLLSYCTPSSSMLSQITEFSSFLRQNNFHCVCVSICDCVVICVYVSCIFLICSSPYGHFSCFHTLATMDKCCYEYESVFGQMLFLWFLQCMKVKSESEVAQSCPTLSDPMDCSLPGSSVLLVYEMSAIMW